MRTATTWIILMTAIGCGSTNVPALSRAYVPTETEDGGELVAQYEADLRENPDHRGTRYSLARIHCFIYAYGRTHFKVSPYREEGALPRIVEAHPFPVRSAAIRLPVSTERLNHLAEAIRLLRRITDNAPNHAAAQLLYGYVCREAAARCQEVGRPDGLLPGGGDVADSVSWERLALDAFRMARENRPPDPERKPIDWNYKPPVYWGSWFIFRMLSARDDLSEVEQAELAAVKSGARATMAVVHGPVEGSFAPEEESLVSPASLKEAEAMFPAMDEQRNGANLYLHAMDAYIAFDFPRDAVIPLTGWGGIEAASSGTLPDKSVQAITAYLSANRECIRLLEEASTYDAYAFPYRVIPAMGVTMSGSESLRTLAQAPMLRAVYACQQEDPKKAADSIVALAGCARAAQSGASTTSVLEAGRVVQLAVEALQWTLARVSFSEESLLAMQEGFSSIQRPDILHRAHEGDRLGTTLIVKDVDARELAVRRKITDINDPNNANIQVSDEEIAEAETRARKEMAAFLQVHQATMNKYLDKLDLPLHELYAAVRSVGEYSIATTRPRDPTAHDPMGRVILTHIASVASTRVAQATLAVARFQARNGDLPDEIDLLVPSYLPREASVDPFNGDTLQFKKANGQFTVYSVGYPRLNQQASARGQGKVPSGISLTVGR